MSTRICCGPISRSGDRLDARPEVLPSGSPGEPPPPRDGSRSTFPLTPVMVMHSHGVGGIERHVLFLMQVLTQRGHRPHFAGPRDSWIGEQLSRAGLPQVHVPMMAMYDFISASRLQCYLRRVKADVVHGHAMRGTRYAVWSGFWAGVPAVGTAHSTTGGRWLRGARAIFPVSAAVRNALDAHNCRRLLSPPMYPGVPDPGAPSAELRARRRALLGIRPDEQILGMVGRFVAAKGHELAVAALHRLRDLPTRLVLVGDDRNEVGDRLRAQVRSLGLESRVLFMGQCENAVEICSTFDVFMQPSRREALGLALIEASAQERPIVAADMGGIPEVVLDGETGLLFPPGDAERLAAAVRRLLTEPALASSLGRMARRHYLAQFTEDAMVDRVVAGYQRAMERA